MSDHPVTFHIGEREYALVASRSPLLDANSYPVSNRIDRERGLMVLGPECTGRDAVSATVTMYVALCDEVEATDSQPSPERDVTALSIGLERILLDCESTDALIEQLGELQEPQPLLQDVRRFVVGSIAVVVILLGGLFLALYMGRPASPATLAIQPYAELSPATRYQPMVYREIDRVSTATLGDSCIWSLPYPDQNRYVVFNAEHELIVVEPSGHRRTVTTLDSPLRTMHVSPEGRLLVAASLDTQLYVIDLEAGRTLHSIDVGQPVAYALHTGENQVTWAGDDGPPRQLDLATGQSTPIPNCQQIVQSPNRLGATARVIQLGSAPPYVEIDAGPQDPTIQTPIQTNQRLAAFDISQDATRIIVTFTDGTGLLYHPDPRHPSAYASTPLPLRFSEAPQAVFVAGDGRQAWVYAGELIKLDTSDPSSIAFERALALSGAKPTERWHALSYLSGVELLLASNPDGAHAWQLP